MSRIVRFRIGLLMSLAAISVVACSALTTFDSLEEDPKAIPSDAGDSGPNTLSKDSSPYVPPDATVNDAGSSDADAGDAQLSDAALVSEGGYCNSLSPQPFLCNDFEPGADAGWQLETSPFNLSTAMITTENALSPPNALKVVVNTTASAPGYSDYTQSFNATGATHVITSYDVFVSSPPTHPLNLSSIKFAVAGFGDRYVSIQLSTQGILTVFQNQDAPRGPDGGVNFTSLGTTNALLNGWMHIVLDVAPGASPTVTASLNKVAFVDTISLAPAFTVTNVRVRSGVSFLTANGATFSAYFDNVVIDFK